MFRFLREANCLCFKPSNAAIHPTKKNQHYCRSCKHFFSSMEKFQNHLTSGCNPSSRRNESSAASPANQSRVSFEDPFGELSSPDRFSKRTYNEKTPTELWKSGLLEDSPYGLHSPMNRPLGDSSPTRSPKKTMLEKSNFSNFALPEQGVDDMIENIKEKPIQIRRKMEAKFIKQYKDKFAAKKYLIASQWISHYSAYLRGDKKDPPGPIDNKEFKKTIMSKTYVGALHAVNEIVWRFLKDLYGGGPEVCQSVEAVSARLTKVDNKMKSIMMDDPHSASDPRHKNITFSNLSRSVIPDVQPFIKPIGMTNEGFLCYLISTLHAILGVSDLTRCMDQEKYKEAMSSKSSKFWRPFHDLIEAHLKDQNNYTPAGFRRLAKEWFYAQKSYDAHGFLLYLLTGLQNEIIGGSIQEIKSPEQQKDQNTHMTFVSNSQISGIYDIFGGVTKDYTKCLACGNKASTYSNFLSLSLPIIPYETKIIDDCLEAFQKEETPSTLAFCSKCNEDKQYSKKSIIYRFPRNLIVHLKRFPNGEKKEKLCDFVNYLSDNWKVKGRGDKDSTIYSLIGTIAHDGSQDIGHYTCYTKRGENWFFCDDKNVKQIASKGVVVQDAYILLFQKKMRE